MNMRTLRGRNPWHFLAVVVMGLLGLLAACGGGGGGSAGTPGPSAPVVIGPPGDFPGPDPTAAPVAVQVRELNTSLSAPWSLAFLPDGRMLLTERTGRRLLLLASNGQGAVALGGLESLAIDTRDQGGLLDVALDPSYALNRRIYLTIAEVDTNGQTGTAVVRAVLDETQLVLREVAVIYRQLPKVASTTHYGGRLAFDRSGALFVTLGDRAGPDQRQFAQDLTRGNGKVVRITTTGSAAPGNPVWPLGAQPEIWTLGHRNPQGAALHPGTGEFWISEHGPQGGDEINRLLPGRNYGWPVVSQGQEEGTTTPVGLPSRADMEDPLWVWQQVDGSPWVGGFMSGIAPAGMAFYQGNQVPQWRGSLFVGALAGQALWRLTLEGNRVVAQERLLADLAQRIRDVREGPDGALYLLTDSGRLLRYGG